MYNLFLDDDPIRIPNKLGWINLPKVEWEITRSYIGFCETITRRGVPTIVSFDHDLADSHYGHDWNKTSHSYSQVKEKTGYHCAEFLVNYCLSNNLKFPEYYVHSMNPVGRNNIIKFIESIKERFPSLT